MPREDGMEANELLNGAQEAEDPCECDGLGFVPMAGGIQRCDLCKRYASDEEARAAARRRVLALRLASHQPFLREEDLQNLPNLYTTEHVPIEQKVAQVKFFVPGSRWTFYAVEFDGIDQLFGWCVSALGSDCDELTYASAAEIVAQGAAGRALASQAPRMVGMERDEHFRPRTLGELLQGRNR
jgi:hypothetical protein